MEQAKALWKHADWENVGPTIVFGTTCGLVGSVVGSLYAVYKPYPRPGLYSFLCFLQYGAYGTVFHGSRAYYLHTQPHFTKTPPYVTNTNSLLTHTTPPLTTSSPSTRSDLLRYSALAGATSGGLINALFRQRYMLSGSLQFALYGFLGQHAFFYLDTRHSRKVARDEEKKRRKEAGEKEQSLLEWTAGKMGMRKMSDEEYAGLLGEKALELEVEIALIDDRIEEVRKEEREKESERVN